MERAADLLRPAYEELILQAAQGELLHNDDTTMKTMDFTGEARAEALPGAGAEARTGVSPRGSCR